MKHPVYYTALSESKCVHTHDADSQFTFMRRVLARMPIYKFMDQFQCCRTVSIYRKIKYCSLVGRIRGKFRGFYLTTVTSCARVCVLQVKRNVVSFILHVVCVYANGNMLIKSENFRNIIVMFQFGNKLFSISALTNACASETK